MKLERRALYNSLRMNWLLDPTLEVETWQVEDYRVMSYKAIFDRLKEQGIHLDRVSFLAMAESHLTPEELSEELLSEFEVDAQTEDQVYLLVFELWRRLVPEKPCLSVFCDELDYQIHLYDAGQANNIEPIQDILANLQVILDENSDEGADPATVFDSICSGCANDIETFLYDFIFEQIDNQNESYASELLDGFEKYIQDDRWFAFLKVRVLAATDSKAATVKTRQLVQQAIGKKDLEYNLELLSFMVIGGEKDSFIKLVKQTANLLQTNEDLEDLLNICADYFHRLDLDDVEQKLQQLIKEQSKHREKKLDLKDSRVVELVKIIS